MSRKTKCCVRECNSRDIHEHRGRGTDNLGRSITFILRICDPCKDGLMEKKVNYTFHNAGTVVFVEEVY